MMSALPQHPHQQPQADGNSTAADGTDQDGLYFRIVCDPGHERTTRELRELPRETRERVWADMTGAPPSAHLMRVEDPEMVRQALVLLEGQLAKIRSTVQILDVCLKSTRLANDEVFRVMMLRAEDFDPERAAYRIAKHFEQKETLFGFEKLDQPICLKDLSGDDLESLQSGGMQFLPRTDRGGRLVFFSRYRNFVYKDKYNLLRALWYMFMSVLDTPNVTSSENFGLVVVGYEVGEFVPLDYEVMRQMFKVVKSLPIKVVASHSCYSDRPMQNVVDLVVHMVSAFARLRFRMHNGSHQECRYRLLTMGIPVDFLPVTMDGVLHTENHMHWLKYRVSLESGR